MLDLDGVKVVAIDFDGTLFEEDFPRIGKPIYPMINYVKYLQKKGIQIILYTLRTDKLLEDAIEACKNVGLEFDSINENLEWRIKLYDNIDPRKIGADYYIDDRAVDAKQLLSVLTTHPCTVCNKGLGSMSTCNSTSCMETCDKLKDYVEINKSDYNTNS